MFKQQQDGESNWMSFTDMMTGLMVIFMLIAVSYIATVDKKSQELDKKAQDRDSIFKEFKATEDDLYANLEEEFKDDFKKWQAVLDKDLSIKFTNPKVLFKSGSSDIKPYFKNILDDFIPKYFNVLEKYFKHIQEIRIEGHTDKTRISPTLKRKRKGVFTDDEYINNMILSQERSVAILKYSIQLDCYKRLPKDVKAHFRFLITANGLSYGKTLNRDGQYTFYSKNKRIDKQKSRRVEFRILTNHKKVIEQVLKQIEKQQ